MLKVPDAVYEGAWEMQALQSTLANPSCCQNK